MHDRLVDRDQYELTRKRWRRRSQLIISKLSPYVLNALLLLQTKMELNPDLEPNADLDPSELFLEARFTYGDEIVLKILAIFLVFSYVVLLSTDLARFLILTFALLGLCLAFRYLVFIVFSLTIIPAMCCRGMCVALVSCVDPDREFVSRARFVRQFMRPFVKLVMLIMLFVGFVMLFAKLIMAFWSASTFWRDVFSTYLFLPSIMFNLSALNLPSIGSLPTIVGFQMGKFTFLFLPLLLDLLELLTSLVGWLGSFVGWLGSIGVNVTWASFSDFKFFDFELMSSPLADVASSALSDEDKVSLMVSVTDDAVDALDALRSVEEMKQLGEAAVRLVRRFKGRSSDEWKELRGEALALNRQIGESESLRNLLTELVPGGNLQELSDLKDQALELKAQFEYCKPGRMSERQ